MFELTNEQRVCFGLPLVQPYWKRIEAKASPYDSYRTFLYLDGCNVVKCVMVGEKYYKEYGLQETLTDDGVYLLPKTAKGKPVKLSASTIAKRTHVGMVLAYDRDWLALYNASTDCAYYTNSHLKLGLKSLPDFIDWVETWCADTTSDDIEDIRHFAMQPRRRVKCKEGDVFRYKIDRRLYGYGRVLLDYAQMRKHKEPFWDILMGQPLVCSAYHIATERKDVTVDELRGLKSLPSYIVADNNLHYGENEIIGNIPISDFEDYPIMYGEKSREETVCYQCGKTYLESVNGELLYHGFKNNGVAFRMNVQLDILLKCIASDSNRPYWEAGNYRTEQDLRNPKFRNQLNEIQRQFGL